MHKAIARKDYPWTTCVATSRLRPECPDERAHGGITTVEICRCGASRLVEVNGTWRNASDWEGGDGRHLPLIERGIELAGAVRYRGRYYHRDDGTQRWYRVTREDLVALARLWAERPRDAYSIWCAERPAHEMPAGWTPF